MLGPQFSSLFDNPDLRESPYLEWLHLAADAKEYINIVEALAGVPRLWVEWADSQIASSCKRGVIVRNPVAYRLTTLWNGIILLQEVKFICDSVENALRQAFVNHESRLNATYASIEPAIPGKGSFVRSYEKDHGDPPSAETVITASLVSCFTFYQLTEVMARYWEKMEIGSSSHIGFSKLFWDDLVCRDKNLFVKDMGRLRKIRNEMAHSKRLFTQAEAQKAYHLAARWLKPLKVTLGSRVLQYRRKRPRFLQNLTIGGDT